MDVNVFKTRPNEFGFMTARKGDIKPEYYKDQGHTHMATQDQEHFAPLDIYKLHFD